MPLNPAVAGGAEPPAESTSQRAVRWLLCLVAIGLMAKGFSDLLTAHACGDCADGTPLTRALLAGAGVAISVSGLAFRGVPATGTAICLTLAGAALLVNDRHPGAGHVQTIAVWFLVLGIVLAILWLGGRKGGLHRTWQGVGRDDRSALVGTGAEATGTVLSVTDTRITVLQDPVVEVRLRIVPKGGFAPYEATTRSVVSLVAIPRPGDEIPIWYDPADPSRVAIPTGIPAPGGEAGLR